MVLAEAEVINHRDTEDTENTRFEQEEAEIAEFDLYRIRLRYLCDLLLIVLFSVISVPVW